MAACYNWMKHQNRARWAASAQCRGDEFSIDSGAARDRSSLAPCQFTKNVRVVTGLAKHENVHVAAGLV